MPSIAEVRQKYPQYNDMSDAALADALHQKFYSDMPRTEFDAKVGATANDNTVDASGAPYSVRAKVGSVPQEMRGEAIRKIYPDAQPSGNGNFTYTDPKTKKKTLYNPEGFDLGDIASILPEVGEGVGGTIGAIDGGALGIPGGAAGVLGGATLGAGAGATIGRESVERASMGLQGLQDTRSLSQQGLDAATTGALNAGGELVGAGVGAGVRAGVRALMRGGKAGQAETQSAISDLERFGATPSVAQATKNRALDSTESLAAKFPGGAGVIRQAAEEQQRKIADGLKTKLTNLAGIAPDELAAGGAITQGVEDFSKNFSDQADVLYGEVGKYLPKQSLMDVANTQAILSEAATPIANAENLSKPLINPKLAQMLSGITADLQKSNSKALPYEAVAKTRSMIGRQLGSPSLGPDAIPRAELKRVYGALTADMRIAAQDQGPNALKAFDRASDFYKAGMDKIDKMLAPLVNKRTPEDVFAAVESTGKRGPTMLKALRSSVTPDQWRLLAATVAERLGQPPANARGDEGDALFSFTKFLSGYKALQDNGSADVLFGGPGMGGIKDDLDALQRASNRIRVSSKAFAKPLDTGASTLIGATMILGAMGSALTGNAAGLATVGAAAGGSFAMAKMLTSPKVVHWLAEGTRVKPNGFSAWVGRATALAASSDPDTRDAIQSFLGNLKAADAPMAFTPPVRTVN